MHPERRIALVPSPRIDLNDTGVFMLAGAALPCRVLVVDDDPQVVAHMSSLLKSGGYEPLSASSGSEALRVLDTMVCQIVLTDWHMPDMDGLALCRQLRLRKTDGYIYVLILTVRDSTTDVVAGLAAGADDYVIKGATPEEILARLEVGRRTTHLERSLRKSNEANRRMAVTDALTGVHNRRFLMKYLPRELERSRRYNHPIAVISCDLDDFKRINDEYGHEAGDEILQAFALRASDCVRKGIDWVARSGGEEFVIVLPETGLHGASRAAERLRAVLATKPISTSSGPLAVTVSMGVTALETTKELGAVSVRELLRAADRYLFASKHLGKDRATVATVDNARTRSDENLEGGRATH
jgi:two-component system cell cycle response regulator